MKMRHLITLVLLSISTYISAQQATHLTLADTVALLTTKHEFNTQQLQNLTLADTVNLVATKTDIASVPSPLIMGVNGTGGSLTGTAQINSDGTRDRALAISREAKGNLFGSSIEIQGYTDQQAYASYAPMLNFSMIKTNGPLQYDTEGYVGSINFGGNHTSAGDATKAYSASISAELQAGDSFSDINTMPITLHFKAGNEANTLTSLTDEIQNTKMVVHPNGVGVGLTEPQATLHVRGSRTIFDNSGGPTHYITGAAETSNLILMNTGATTSQSLSYIDLGGTVSGQDVIIGGQAVKIKTNVTNTNEGTEVISINSAGAVGINTSSPTATLDVSGNIKTEGIVNNGTFNNLGSDFTILDSSSDPVLKVDVAAKYVGIDNLTPNVALDVVGSIEYTGSLTNVSDIRLKENFSPIDSALSIVKQITPTYYTLKGDDKIKSGYIAQNVQDNFPHVVKVVDQAGTLGVDYTQITPLLHQALLEQQKLIEALIAEIKSLKG